MAGQQQHTTQSLRKTLFQAIDDLKNHRIDTSEAASIAKLSGEIIKTADIELKYASVCSRLDKEEQGVSPGPLLLAEDSSE